MPEQLVRPHSTIPQHTTSLPHLSSALQHGLAVSTVQTSHVPEPKLSVQEPPVAVHSHDTLVWLIVVVVLDVLPVVLFKVVAARQSSFKPW
jgi:hypothetical protein